jgi:hypothetical protein
MACLTSSGSAFRSSNWLGSSAGAQLVALAAKLTTAATAAATAAPSWGVGRYPAIALGTEKETAARDTDDCETTAILFRPLIKFVERQ